MQARPVQAASGSDSTDSYRESWRERATRRVLAGQSRSRSLLSPIGSSRLILDGRERQQGGLRNIELVRDRFNC
jgi:hypothetical protein